MAKITESFVKALEATGKRRFVMDCDLKGFGVRINVSGHKTYILRYRIGAQQRTYSIGDVAKFTAAQARQLAKELLADVTKGIDPAVAKEDRREMRTFKQWSEEYLETSQKITIKEDKSKLDQVLVPALGSRRIDEINDGDIRKILKKLIDKERTPATVNRYRSLLSVMFSRAIDSGLLNQNPVSSVKPLKENNELTRYLSDEEYGRITAAIENAPTNAGNLILMLLYTGRRRGDVMKMRWEDVSLESGFWRIPKDQNSWQVPLTDPIRAVLDEQRKSRVAFNPYVFPGRNGKSHIKNPYHAWSKVREEADLQDLRIHDLRHAYAGRLAQANIDLYTIANLIGHKDLKTTKRYSHLSGDSLRNAAEKGVIVPIKKSRDEG
ncbi:site-specific integrase [Solemya velum gill symbiont]|uniref:site-specific integrase n=1 Tax=Solemya velum gill symbiont TaxID=2340 RepID=UPI000996B8B3|nr:site-specific integrase [Solemya velum gill symbiont]